MAKSVNKSKIFAEEEQKIEACTLYLNNRSCRGHQQGPSDRSVGAAVAAASSVAAAIHSDQHVNSMNLFNSPSN